VIDIPLSHDKRPTSKKNSSGGGGKRSQVRGGKTHLPEDGPTATTIIKSEKLRRKPAGHRKEEEKGMGTGRKNTIQRGKLQAEPDCCPSQRRPRCYGYNGSWGGKGTEKGKNTTSGGRTLSLTGHIGGSFVLPQ